mgnify:CR=1 FL=1
MAQALNTSYPDLTTTEHIPDQLRLWDRDKKIINYAKGRLTNMRIMMRQFADRGKMATKDMHVKYKSDIDRQALVKTAAASGSYASGVENMIYIADSKANLIDEGAVLINNGMYYNGSDYSTTLGSTGGTQNEAMLVLQRGVSDGTKTWFVVQRGFGYSLNTPIEIPSGTEILIEPRSIGEGSNEARVWGDTPSEEYNYCEIFLEKYGATKLSQDIETLYEESMFDRNGSRTLNLLFKKMELASIDGRRGTRLIGDRRVWYTRGLDDYIESTNADLGYPEEGASKNVVNFLTTMGTLSSTTLNSFLSDKFFWGNETEKFWNLPVRDYVGICNAFDNKVRIAYNKDLSLKYKLNISTLESSGGGLLHLTVSDLWSIYNRPFSYIIDYDSFKYMHLRNHDLQIIKNAEEGMNRFEIVNYIYGTFGFILRNPHAHWKIYNIVPSA